MFAVRLPSPVVYPHALTSRTRKTSAGRMQKPRLNGEVEVLNCHLGAILTLCWSRLRFVKTHVRDRVNW